MTTPTFQLPQSFQVRLTMTSDWHVGSGTGRPGNIDRLVLRDDDGFPFVPAKTLTGIWRDACELAALDLDNGNDEGRWSQWVSYLFGEQPARTSPGTHTPEPPRPALLSVRPASYPDDLRPHLRGESSVARAYQSALTFVQPGVKIDKATGRAKDDHLRFVEMTRGDVKLFANCELKMEDKDRMCASALLLAGAKLVARLGGKRRRGAGLCTLEVLDPTGRGFDLKSVADWIEKNLTAPAIPGIADGKTTAITATVATGEWLTVPITIELLTPLAVTYRTVGNVMETLDFVPGTHFLPHVTRVLEQIGVPARGAIARGDIRVLNATIAIDDASGRPVPFAIETLKDSNGLKSPPNVRNLMCEDVSDDDKRQFKPVREGYLGALVNNHIPQHLKVEKTLRTHSTIDEEKQRPTAEVGGVFSNEVISSRQGDGLARLRTELRLRKDLLPGAASKDDWWKELDGECRLGRTKKDDYGRVRLTAGPPASLSATIPGKETHLDVWLLSDLLLRTDALRPRATVCELLEALEAQLGVKLEVAKNNRGIARAFVRARRTESWNAAWILPRPSLVALQAGSCVRFRITGTADPKKLAEIEAAGLGERTAEGFGQMSFNDPFLAAIPATLLPPTVNKDSNSAGTPEGLRANQPGYDTARQLEKHVWQESIRRAALAFADAENGARRKALLHWTDKKPGMSQLGALREAVHSVRDIRSAGGITAWLKGVRATKNREDKWPDGSLKAIEELLKPCESVWKPLRGTGEVWECLTVDGELHLKEKLWALAVRSLIDACIRAHKRELDAKRQNQGQAATARRR